MKNILVLPAADAQIPLLKKIQQMGYAAHTVNPYPDSPGFAFSADHLQADIFDFEQCLKYAKALHADAVVSDQCDIASGPVSRLAQSLGLPCNTE